jgi:hypothetical protein
MTLCYYSMPFQIFFFILGKIIKTFAYTCIIIPFKSYNIFFSGIVH